MKNEYDARAAKVLSLHPICFSYHSQKSHANHMQNIGFLMHLSSLYIVKFIKKEIDHSMLLQNVFLQESSVPAITLENMFYQSSLDVLNLICITEWPFLLSATNNSLSALSLIMSALSSLASSGLISGFRRGRPVSHS